MATNRQVRAFLNVVSKKMYKKRYGSLGNKRAAKVRKKAAKLVK